MSYNNIKQLPEDQLCKQNSEPPSKKKPVLDETFEMDKDIPPEISPALANEVKTSTNDLADSLQMEYDEHSARKSLESTQNCSFSSTKIFLLDDNGCSDIINVLDDVLSQITDKTDTSSPASAPIKYNTTEEVNETMDLCTPLEKSSKPRLEDVVDDNASTAQKENVCDQTIAKNEPGFDKESFTQDVSNETTDRVFEALNETFPKEENVCNLKVEELTSVEALKMNAAVVIDLSETIDVEDIADIVYEALDETFPKEENLCKILKVEEVTLEEALKVNTSVIDLSETITDEETSGIVFEALNETFPNEENRTLNVEGVTSEEALKLNTVVVDLSDSVNEEVTNIVSEALNETLPKEDVCKTVEVEHVASEKVLTPSEQMDNIDEKVYYHDESTISCDEIKVSSIIAKPICESLENSFQVFSSSDPPAIQRDLSFLKKDINQLDQESQSKDSVQQCNVLNDENILLQPSKSGNTTVRSDLEDSSREILFSDALSSSVVENRQESIVSSPSVQWTNSQSSDKVKGVETERNDYVPTPVQLFKSRKSAIDIIRSKLTDVEAYSPSRLALAAAFDNLKINTTPEDSFLSCEETSLLNDILGNDETMDISENLHSAKTEENFENPVLVENIENNVTTRIDSILDNDEEMNISLENVHATKSDENVEDPILVENSVVTTEKEMDSICESKPQSNSGDKSGVSLNSTLSEDVFELTPRKSTEDLALVVEDALNVTQQNNVGTINNAASLKPDGSNLNMQGISLIPRKSRRSSGIMISAMNFGMTPSPVKQHLDYLDNKYNKLFTESPSAVERRKPEFERYLALKLEINHLQQDIAKLTLQLKQKEGEVIQLVPQKVKFPSVIYKREIKNTLQEGSKLAEEKAALQAEVQELFETLDKKNTELQDKINSIENELEVVKEEAGAQLQKNKYIDEELTAAKETVKQLEHCLNETNRVLIDATSKLHNAEESYTREKQKHESTSNALHQMIDKYEEIRRIVLAMKANEIIYKETIEKLRSDNDDLHKTYEGFKKTALQKIDEANKENERIRGESTNKNILKKRNSRQH